MEGEHRDYGTLLVVDDNEMNRDMLSRRLERLGFTVRAAADGAAALQLTEKSPPDLILLDVVMPGLSGLEVLKTLRERHSPTDLPIIMATAKDESKDIVEALEAGANDYVTKPLDFPVVLARLRMQLALKRAHEQILHLERTVLQLRKPPMPARETATIRNPGLAEITAAWPTLSDAVQRQLLQLIRQNLSE